MQTSREVVARTIRFARAWSGWRMTLPEPYGTRLCRGGHDARRRMTGPAHGRDEWGAVWENIGVCQLGEVKEFPLKTGQDFDQLPIPDIHDPTALGGLWTGRASGPGDNSCWQTASRSTSGCTSSAAWRTPGWTSTTRPTSWAA